MQNKQDIFFYFIPNKLGSTTANNSIVIKFTRIISRERCCGIDVLFKNVLTLIFLQWCLFATLGLVGLIWSTFDYLYFYSGRFRCYIGSSWSPVGSLLFVGSGSTPSSMGAWPSLWAEPSFTGAWHLFAGSVWLETHIRCILCTITMACISCWTTNRRKS